jgi:uncharacterized protein (DUF1778 family)
LKPYNVSMARTGVENGRLEMRLSPEDKSRLMRAAALLRCDLTDFAKRTLMQAADEVIEKAERVALSARDSKRLLKLLDNPPEPNEQFIAAMRAYKSQ